MSSGSCFRRGGTVPLSEITRRDIRDLIDGIADREAPIMALRVHAYVHRFFGWCVGRDIVEANPATDLPKVSGETRRDRVLSDEELIAVWEAAGKIGWPFGDAIRLVILTGARREEIGQLKWSEIRGDLIALKGARTKNAEPHNIPLSLAASILLRPFRALPTANECSPLTARFPSRAGREQSLISMLCRE